LDAVPLELALQWLVSPQTPTDFRISYEGAMRYRS
jgi:hypothetical protein